MKLSQEKVVACIRERSDPVSDFNLAIKSNASLLDCLYRLTFTADKLHASQVDELINALQRKPNEITVLLTRIKYVKQHGIVQDS